MHIIHKGVNPVRKIWGKLAYHYPGFRLAGEIIYTLTARSVGWYEMEKEKEAIAKNLSIPKAKVKAFDHHVCHAFSAYYASSFNQEKSLVFVLDGEGDDCSSTVYIFNKDKHEQLARSPRSASLGAIYAYVTEFLGMKSNEHEYKVMGLAPYAKEEDVEKVYKKIKDIIFLDIPYFHVTHLKRSNQARIYNKFKLELGKPFSRNFNYPEVFYRQYPESICNPWQKLSSIKFALATIITPLRRIKRKFQ